MKCYVDKIIIATLLFLASTIGCTNSAFALFDGGSGNVGTDWTNTDKNLHTTGSGTFDNDLVVGDDVSITGDLTASGIITLNTTKLNSKLLRSDYDYTSLAIAFSSIGAVTPTRLSICQDNIIADGITLTQTSNIVLDFSCGGTVDGIAGGGTETLVLNGPSIGLDAIPTRTIFKSNLIVTNNVGITNLKIIETISALRDYSTSFFASGSTIQLSGYFTSGDGGGGPLRTWDTASTCTDNGGNCVKPTAIGVGDPGRWIWEHNGPISPRWFGAKCDGTTDDGAIINTALAHKEGAQVWIEEETCATSVALEVPSAAELKGVGGGQYPAAPYASSANFISTPKSRILALAGFPSGTPVVEVKTADNALYTHQNVRIRGLMIDCANVADYGLNVVSVKNSRFEDILVYLPVLVGIIEDNLPTAVAVTEGNSATQFNVWQNVVSWTGNTGSAIGWQQLGNNINDVNQCTYIGCGTVTADGDGIQIKGADTNTWIMLHTYNFGAGKGVRLYGSDDASAPFAYAHGNIFYNPIFAGNHHSGTAQTGSANTITLTAGASSSDSIYVGRQIVITALTGLGQRRIVSGYNGTTKIATVSQSWSTQPDSTSGYAVYAGGIAAQAGTTANSQRNAIFGLGYGSGPIIVDPGATFAYDPPLHVEGIYTQLFTPAITFITPGDLSVSYAVAEGRYWLRGNLCKFVIDLTFTPTYTTASSHFQITGLPFPSIAANRGADYYTASVSSSDTTWTFGTSKTQIAGRIVAGGSYIRLIGLGSGVLNAFCGVAEFPSGTAKTLHIEGEYELAN
jgi:hypothetical protein